jgi:hypothetical protein
MMRYFWSVRMESGAWIGLREFLPSELLFDERETRDILKFFFPMNFPAIDATVMTDAIRGFAQGLLIEAIDATAALGWVEVLFWIDGESGCRGKTATAKACQE